MTQKEIAKYARSPTKRINQQIKQQHGAEFFPVASGVQIPYVGRDDSVAVGAQPQTNTLYLPVNTVKKRKPKTRLLGDVLDPFFDENERALRARLAQATLYLPDISARRERRQQKQQLHEISQKLDFAEDVATVHCPHVVDYHEDELNKAIGRRATRRMKSISRARSRRAPQSSAGVKKDITEKSDPEQLSKVQVFQEIDAEMKQEMDDLLYCLSKTSRPGRLSVVQSGDLKKVHPRAKSAEWDEYVLSLLSPQTASWITQEFSTGTQHSRLLGFLRDRYQKEEKDGQKDAEKDEAERAKLEQSKRRNSKAGAELAKMLTNTMFNVQHSPSFTLPPAVGDKKFVTDNVFEQEMLAGGFPIKGKKLRNKSIVLNTNSKLTFEKKLQPNYPEDPKKWYHGEKRHSKVAKHVEKVKVTKGLQKWNQLPALLQDHDYVPSFQTTAKPVRSMAEAELQLVHKTKENDNILRISEEWRSKWLLEQRWQNSSTEELLKGMTDIHDHVRLAAVAACSKAAEVRQRKKAEQGFGPPSADSKVVNFETIKCELEPELLECITKLLDDKCKQVSITAAVTLSTLGVAADTKAVDILHDAVKNGSAIERWAAAQSLASTGYCTDTIISELVAQTSCGDLPRQEQAAVLLLKLSNQSSLVHAVVAEQLNSDSCHDRLIACRLLPRLKGTLNKDVAQKLSHMMWNDWQKTVRTAAAQALGRTGNGKLVHDVLLKRLTDDNERTKVDALRKLANLGVMTAHLLPAFLACFNNQFDTVRLEAVMAAGVINTPDDDMVSGLVKLANEDQNWKIKAHAIKALGAIGKVTEELVEMLVWNMRYSKLAAVRAEACNAVGQLGLKDTRCLTVLQDRLIVENEQVVRREAQRALETLNVEITGDIEMVNTIRTEVQRLCNKNNIVSAILHQDEQDEYEHNYQRMIAADSQHPSRLSTQTPLTSRSQKSAATSLGWDPILAGYRARSVLSEPGTPAVTMRMERSRLPMDLESNTSDGSLGSREDLDDYPDSEASDIIPADNAPHDIGLSDNVPPDIVPSDILPSDIIPSDIIPSDIVPSDIIPSDIVPSDIIPSDIVRSDITPSNIVPQDSVPTDIVPTNSVLPVEKSQVVDNGNSHSGNNSPPNDNQSNSIDT